MPKGRKTIEVNWIKERVNSTLASPGDTYPLVEGLTPEQAFRMGVSVVMGQILHHTGNYHGFNLQGSEFLPADEQVDRKVLREGHDDTRRVFY